MKNIFELFGKKPKISPGVYIDPLARIMGDVEIDEGVAILFGTIVRGDDAPVKIGRNVAILENCVIEAPKNHPIYIGSESLVSHGAIIHGARIGRNVLIGIGAIILDGAEIGENSIVAAGSVVPPGKKYEPFSLILGAPAKKVRDVTEDELNIIHEERKRVLEKSRHYPTSLTI